MSGITDRAAGLVDGVLDAAVVPGFTRVGYAVRSRLRHFRPLTDYSLAGRTVVLTGPTSGLGRAAAEMLAAMGASLVLVGRNPGKLVDVAAAMIAERSQHGRGPEAGTIATVVAEMGDLAAVRAAAAEIAARHGSIDAVIHNAGALLNQRQLSAQGFEQTIASHVLGPHLLTSLLLPNLRAAAGRVVTVSSGGMYAAGLGSAEQIAAGSWPQMPPKQYDGTKQYAIAKRIQVTLNELWVHHEPDVTFAAMHPGWADTPGVQQSIPTFRRVTRPLLRTAEQGADTIAWLAAEPAVAQHSGAFWCDRSVRPIHRLPGTRRSDTPAARAAVWEWCQQQSGAAAR
jgi:NAD(P)-dependent dehydrogenase (short-subunit alcohol dehydrogenase family)